MDPADASAKYLKLGPAKPVLIVLREDAEFPSIRLCKLRSSSGAVPGSYGLQARDWYMLPPAGL